MTLLYPQICVEITIIRDLISSKKINELEKSLSRINSSVNLSWIPGHCDVQANEEVDRLARALATDIHKTRVSAPSFISLAAAFQRSAEIAKESWQRKWNDNSALRS